MAKGLLTSQGNEVRETGNLEFSISDVWRKDTKPNEKLKKKKDTYAQIEGSFIFETANSQQ